MAEGRSDRPLRFRIERFDEVTAAMGMTNIAAQARFLKIDHGSLWRVRHGERRPGSVFVGRVLHAPWPEPVTFYDFFEFEEAS